MRHLCLKLEISVLNQELDTNVQNWKSDNRVDMWDNTGSVENQILVFKIGH